MPDVTIVRPQVILKDSQNNELSSHDFEFQAVVAAEELVAGTYTIERPTATITVTAS